MECMKDIVKIRINKDVRDMLEEYIVENRLYRQKVTIKNLGSEIVREWIKNPVLDKKLIVTTTKKVRNGMIGFSLTEDENIKLNKIFVNEYIRECRTLSVLIHNIILQFLHKNYEGFKIDEI
ncbi:MAG: hypothetical protein E7C47_10285 [Veillonella sp.]|uniref:hypothetical protein n=1 Tax=Veillonella sp. TaxID=1926307 RepID=UPI0028FED238|nr:hypothetical protein [Veillonella sp.]MDU2702512.1 hypothetical protein [Veillonella sp.]